MGKGNILSELKKIEEIWFILQTCLTGKLQMAKNAVLSISIFA